MVEIFKSLKKYNAWNGEKIDAGFVRKMYTEKIGKFSGNNLIKVILGQRLKQDCFETYPHLAL